MRRCSAEQGHGKAARALGVDLSTDGHYQEALEAFQLGLIAGDSTSASFLSKGFLGPKSDDRLYYLGQQEDLERAERYEKIWRILANYSYAAPKVPEINDILPLPPAKLPTWDGKLQWLEARLANVPPEKPSEALIQQLAKAKLLEPATGRPTPSSPAAVGMRFHASNQLRAPAHTRARYRENGRAAPQTLIFCVRLPIACHHPDKRRRPAGINAKYLRPDHS